LIVTLAKNTGETERICNGRICDYCGVELDNDFNDENFPNVMYEIHDVGNAEEVQAMNLPEGFWELVKKLKGFYDVNPSFG